MNSKTWTYIIIGILVLLNGYALYSMWHVNKKYESIMQQTQPHQLPHHPTLPPQAPKIEDIFQQELQFSTKQFNEFRALKLEHQKVVKEMLDEIKMHKEELFNSIGKEGVDYLESATQIGDLQTKIEIETHKHFQKVRTICNKEQKIKFDAIIQSIAHRMEVPPQKR